VDILTNIIYQNENYIGKLIIITYKLIFEKSDGYYPGESDEELVIIDIKVIK